MNWAKSLIPRALRRRVRKVRDRIRLKGLRRIVQSWYESLEAGEKERYSIEMEHIRKYGAGYFPYPWAVRSQRTRIRVHRDGDGMHFVMRNGHPLFFPPTWDRDRVREYYEWLLVEQDPQSPHLYSTLDGNGPGGRAVVMDVGSAEGIWAFDNAPFADQIILCEPEREWYPALEKTFSQLGRPFRIVERMIGARSDDRTSTVDALLEGHDDSAIAIKLDVEGHELDALAGSAHTMSRSPWTSWDICLYHKPGDEKDVIAHFTRACRFLCSIRINRGYMQFLDEKNPCAPFLRRGVVHIFHEESAGKKREGPWQEP